MQGPWRTAASLAVTTLMTVGCVSHITNLTPSVVPHEESGLYHFEVEWTSNQRTRELRQDLIQAHVVLDERLYPMERVPLMTNRWEAEVPVPAAKNPVHYYFKWNYATAGFGRNHPNSLRSPPYRLEIAAPDR